MFAYLSNYYLCQNESVYYDDLTWGYHVFLPSVRTEGWHACWALQGA
jgi:hypothetical protein